MGDRNTGNKLKALVTDTSLGNILIASGLESQANNYSEELKIAGYNVLVAYDGVSAAKLIGEGNVDLVVMGSNKGLPHFGILEEAIVVPDALKADGLPVVINSAHIDPGYKDSPLEELGIIQGSVLKSSNPTAWIGVVKKSISKRK